MGLSNSILAYQDCAKFMERAVDDPKGARVPFRTEQEAEYWRMRCYQYRKLDRAQNKIVFNPGDKMFGLSVFDELSLTIKHSEDGWAWVYAQKITINPGVIESLSEVPEVTIEGVFEEVRLLEGGTNGDKTPS
jgi:hypothetical protein